MTMCLHIDGSAIRHARSQSSSKKWTLGWAMVVNNGLAERQGAVTGSQEIHGEHEMVAFIEAVIYAKSCGVAPHDLVVYTDDAMIGHASFYMWPGNCKGSYRDKLIDTCSRVLKELYSVTLLESVIEYLEGARIHKLKGHVGLIYQERADFLARTSAYQHMGVKEDSAQMLSYDDWLERGFVRYRANDVVEVKYAPFVGH